MKKFASLCMSLGLGLSFSALLAGCGDVSTNPTPTPPVDPTPPMVPITPTPTSLSGMISGDQTVSGNVNMLSDVTVPAGAKLTIAAGSVITAAGAYALVVKGSLVVQGTAGSVVNLTTATGITGWNGIAVSGSGSATISYAKIENVTGTSGPQTAFTATAGTTYALDHVTIDQSQGGLALSSTGTVSKTVFTGQGANQHLPALTISDSSPTFTDFLANNGNAGQDSVIVSGTSSPKFDHVEITGYHCAFHFNGGSNIAVTNSNIHDNYYAVMVYSVAPFSFMNSNLVNNQTANIGDCSTGSAVTASGNFYGGASSFDQSCLGQTNTSPAGAMIAGAGYRP